MAKKAVDGYRAGETRPVYGGYASPHDGTLSIYTNGDVPKEMRDAVCENSLENEVITAPMPDTIEEINMALYGDAYDLILTNGTIRNLPKPEGKQITLKPSESSIKPVSGFVLIEHKATIALRANLNSTPNQLELLFPESINHPPNLRTA